MSAGNIQQQQHSTAGATVGDEEATEPGQGDVTVENISVDEHGRIDVNNIQSRSNYAQAGNQTVNIHESKLGWKGWAAIAGVLVAVVLVSVLPPVLLDKKNSDSQAGIPASGSTPAITPALGPVAPTVSGHVASAAIASWTAASSSVTSSSIPSSTIAPPQFTADGLYFLNFNASEGPITRGSAFAYFDNMNLDGNAYEKPDDLAIVREGGYIEWENATTVGNFTRTGTVFTGRIDLTAAELASKPVNAPVGTAWLVGPSGEPYRNFTVYKATGEPFGANGGRTYYQNYYAG